MRRSLIAFVLLAALASGQSALAQKLMLAHPVVLRAGPEAHYAAIGQAPAGEWINILRDEPRWTRIAIDRQRFYVATVELVFMSSTLTETSGCDFGYPYSGGNHYFLGGLTELRHVAPLGALFGYHRSYPCADRN